MIRTVSSTMYRNTHLSIRRATLSLLALVVFGLSAVLANATTLAVPGTATGSISATTTSQTYSVIVPSDGNVTFTIAGDANLYSHLVFLDSDGISQLGEVYASFGSSATLTIPHLAPGATYFARVSAYSGTGTFTLSDTLAQPAVAIDAEPNDTAATATATLTVGTPLTGHMGYSRTSYTTVDTADYYKVVVAADGDLTFTISGDANLYSHLVFLDSDGASQLAEVYASFGASATLTIPHLAPGATYYAKVSSYSGYGGYTLSDTLAQPAIPIDVEPNDTHSTGRTFKVGTTSSGHMGYSRTSYNTVDTADYYKVKVVSDGNLTLTITGDANLYSHLVFFDSNGTTQLFEVYASFGASGAVTIPHLSPGATYYAKVSSYSGYGGYTLSGVLVKPTVNGDAGTNDTYTHATTFTLNSTRTGHMGYSHSSYNSVDIADYYKVTVTAGGSLVLTITGDSNLYSHVTVFSTNGTTQISEVYASFGTSATLTTSLPAAGTYYIRVSSYSGYGGYTLKNTF